ALPVPTPTQGAALLAAAAGEGFAAVLLFCGERAGLGSDDIALCQAIVTVPVDARFRSLNLAQAVAVNAYEWRLTRDAGVPAPFREGAPPAEQGVVLGLYEQLEGELDAAGFFHPPEKRPSMVRNLRVALGRAQLSDQEARTLRGVVTALAKGRGRVLAKLAARREAASAKEGGPDVS
ncbi:MAG: TrmH family RNA methyltransferase, partial [Caulobacteraceae bacterium]